MVGDETPAAALRKLRLGDSWSYSVSGSLVSPDGGTLPLTGEIEVSIVPEELPGRAGQMAIQFSQNFRGPSAGRRQEVPARPDLDVFHRAGCGHGRCRHRRRQYGAERRATHGQGAAGLLSGAMVEQHRLTTIGSTSTMATMSRTRSRSLVRNGLKRPAEPSLPGNRRSPARAWRWAGSRAWTGGRPSSGRPRVSRRTRECRTGLACASWRRLSDTNVLPK